MASGPPRAPAWSARHGGVLALGGYRGRGHLRGGTVADVARCQRVRCHLGDRRGGRAFHPVRARLPATVLPGAGRPLDRAGRSRCRADRQVGRYRVRPGRGDGGCGAAGLRRSIRPRAPAPVARGIDNRRAGRAGRLDQNWTYHTFGRYGGGMTTRAELLDHAIAVLRRGDVLTLDALAAESGLTKAGVVHHVSTKEGLMSAVVDHIIDGWENDLHQLAGPDADGATRLRAYVEHALTGATHASDLPVLADPHQPQPRPTPVRTP